MSDDTHSLHQKELEAQAHLFISRQFSSSKDERVVNLCAARNDTEGGIPEWIYYLQEYLVQGINGITVCPYQQQKKDWNVCPKYEDATNPQTNPISFNVTGIEYSSDSTEIKRQLVALGTPATWVSMLVKQTINILCKDLPFDSGKCEQQQQQQGG